jgi:hypothetical protein
VLEGCVQATGDPAVFLLAVPARFPDPDRGIATGEPLPDDGGFGPAPRRDPRTVPPRFPEDEPRRPQGRYETPTVKNRTFRLEGVDPAGMVALIGARVRAAGDIPVEGFPSGDLAEPRDTAPTRLIPPLHVRELVPLANTCQPLTPASSS